VLKLRKPLHIELAWVRQMRLKLGLPPEAAIDVKFYLTPGLAKDLNCFDVAFDSLGFAKTGIAAIRLSSSIPSVNVTAFAPSGTVRFHVEQITEPTLVFTETGVEMRLKLKLEGQPPQTLLALAQNDDDPFPLYLEPAQGELDFEAPQAEQEEPKPEAERSTKGMSLDEFEDLYEQHLDEGTERWLRGPTQAPEGLRETEPEPKSANGPIEANPKPRKYGKRKQQ
jgi:hypothetical protein